MKSVNFRIPDELAERLDDLCKRTRVIRSVYIIEALEILLDEYDRREHRRELRANENN
jgi:predicted DNA-binding protein